MGYRKRVLDNTTKLKDPSHPRHHGITMQAHHLLSKQGVKDSGLDKKLEHLGYDINHLKNVALIPSTLPGACHLKTQLHRGNHTTVTDSNDDDDEHDDSYHEIVVKLVRTLENEINYGENCSERAIIKLMNIYSKRMAKKINYGSDGKATALLTDIAGNFAPANNMGCKNSRSIPKARESQESCKEKRIHGFQIQVKQIPYKIRPEK